jgi:putative phosphoesterase
LRLCGSDRILHAGDIGAPEILKALAKIAPVTAVRGNVDIDPWARSLPETEVVEAGGVSIYILHDLAQLDLKPLAAGFRVFVYGHSHRPEIEQKNDVLYFNPGSAGPSRFHLPVSVGRLMIGEGGFAQS